MVEMVEREGDGGGIVDIELEYAWRGLAGGPA